MTKQTIERAIIPISSSISILGYPGAAPLPAAERMIHSDYPHGPPTRQPRYAPLEADGLGAGDEDAAAQTLSSRNWAYSTLQIGDSSR